MKQIFIVITFFCLFLIDGPAQEQYNITPSPDGMALVKNVNGTLQENSGAINISVPLYEFEYNSIRVPISLDYVTTGIKVGEMASSVGMGWHLSAGGRITRIVKRYPDEATNGKLKTVGNDLSTAINKTLPNSSSGQLFDYDFVDSEPDLFYYEFCGRRGFFMCVEDKTISYTPDNRYAPPVRYTAKICKTFPESDLQITWTNDTFSIMDESGLVYIFGGGESYLERFTARYYNPNFQYNVEGISSWMLQSVYHTNHLPSAFSNNGVSFTYSQGADISYDQNLVLSRYQVGSNGPEKSGNNMWIGTEITIHGPKYLRSITGGLSQAKGPTFTTSARSDIKGALKYSSIQVYDFGKNPMMSFDLEYTQTVRGYPVLDKVTKTVGSEVHPLYEFAYYNIAALPERNSYSFDHTGYFNNSMASLILPAVRWTNNTGNKQSYQIAGMTREPSPSHARTGMLTKVTYRGKGYTEYNYELNTVLVADPDNTSRQMEKNMGGVRIKSIIHNPVISPDNDPKPLISTFYYGQGLNNYISSGVAWDENYYNGSYYHTYKYQNNTYIDLLSHNLSATPGFIGSPVTYSTIVEQRGDGTKVLREYTTPKDYPSDQYEFTKNISEFNNETVVSCNNFWKYGLLKKVELYDENNRLTGCDKFYYDFEGDNNILSGGYWRYGSFYSFNFSPQRVRLTQVENMESPYSLYKKTSFTYSREHNNIAKITVSDKSGNEEVTEYRWLYDTGIYNIPPAMVPDNLFSLPGSYPYATAITKQDNILLETIFSRNGFIMAAESYDLKSVLFAVPQFTNLTKEIQVVDKVYSLVFDGMLKRSDLSLYNPDTGSRDSRYSLTSTVLQHERRGRPAAIQTYDNKVTSLVYNSYGKVVAKVMNAVYCPIEMATQFLTSFENYVERKSEVAFEDFEYPSATYLGEFAKSGSYVALGSFEIDTRAIIPGSYLLTYYRSRDKGVTWNKEERTVQVTATTNKLTYSHSGEYIDDVLLCPHNALAETFSYSSDGITTHSAVNGMSTHYSYDRQGRLATVRDGNHNMLKRYMYDVDMADIPVDNQTKDYELSIAGFRFRDDSDEFYGMRATTFAVGKNNLESKEQLKVAIDKQLNAESVKFFEVTRVSEPAVRDTIFMEFEPNEGLQARRVILRGDDNSYFYARQNAKGNIYHIIEDEFRKIKKGEMCSITLSGSDKGVVYQLKRNGSFLEAMEGTGDPLVFTGYYDEGTYLIVTTTDIVMRGSTTLKYE